MSAVSSPTFEIRFAAESDHLALQKWTDYLADDSVQDAKDAADYACEAVRRWKTYGDKNLAPSSIDACLKQIGQNPTSDTAILIVLEHANWKANDPFLFAYLRRTGFGNLYLEFLAKHPLAFISESGPSNILRPVLAWIGDLATKINSEFVWWEATNESVELYRRVVGEGNLANIIGIRDLFVVRPTILAGVYNKTIA